MKCFLCGRLIVINGEFSIFVFGKCLHAVHHECAMKQFRIDNLEAFVYINGLPVIKDRSFNLPCPKCMDNNTYIEHTLNGYPIALIIEFKDDYGIYITSDNMLKSFNNPYVYYELRSIYRQACQLGETIRLKVQLDEIILRDYNHSLYRIRFVNVSPSKYKCSPNINSIDKADFFKIVDWIIC